MDSVVVFKKVALKKKSSVPGAKHLFGVTLVYVGPPSSYRKGAESQQANYPAKYFATLYVQPLAPHSENPNDIFLLSQ